jgi:phosphatidylglycerophosphatase A
MEDFGVYGYYYLDEVVGVFIAFSFFASLQ